MGFGPRGPAICAAIACATLTSVAACGDSGGGPSGRPHTTTSTGARETGPALAPRTVPGHIAFAGTDHATLYITNANGRGHLRVLGSSRHGAEALSWSPDGTMLGYLESMPGEPGGERLRVVTLRPRLSSRTLLAGHMGEWLQLSWAPSHDSLALVRAVYRGRGRDGRIDLLSTGGAVRERGPVRDVVLSSRVAWSPDSRKLVYRLAEHRSTQRVFGRLGMVSLGAGHRVALPTPMPATDPDWSPDGRLIAVATAKGIAVVGPSGAGFHIVAPGVRNVTPTWSPDSRWIAFVHSAGCATPTGPCAVALLIVSSSGGPVYYVRRSPTSYPTKPVWGR